MCHYVPHNHRSTSEKSLASLRLAKLTKNGFLTAPTATLTLCMNHHDFNWHTACCFAHVLWDKNKRKKKRKRFKKSAPFMLAHSTDTREPRADDLDSNWLNRREGSCEQTKQASRAFLSDFHSFLVLQPSLTCRAY